MVVVTSPIGDQAPPALAAMTTILVYHNLSSLFLINFRSKVTITMVVVRLSMIADRIKAIPQTIQSNFFLLLVVTRSFNIWKPW